MDVNIPASTFVTIDVEWATRNQMICQIGLAGATIDGMTKNTYTLLVGNRNVGLPKLAKYEKKVRSVP